MNKPLFSNYRPISHRRPAPFKNFYFGAAYYPEHWDSSLLDNDAGRMAAAGFNVVRMGEFAWHMMEPREGEFDFAFFDEAIARLARHGIMTIMCTPTAAAPRWLTQHYPDTLRVDSESRPLQHGSRQQCCSSNFRYREFSRRISSAMQTHFLDNPHVIGWQTDNEMNCHFSECHCLSCQEEFRHFLQQKYVSIDQLNKAWGTVFWALHFDDFGQIETPRPNRPTYCNPSQQLDYSRFLSHSAAMFQRDQVEILREAGRDWFIFHNGCMRNIDYRGDFSRDLDILGYDSYPMFVHSAVSRRFSHAYNLDSIRSLTGNFIIPEHQSGPGGQAPYLLGTPEPGEMRKLSYVSIARGGDSLLYFRWRTCRFGAEEYWCGILDHDDVPRRRYQETCQIGAELRLLGPELHGTFVKIDCAVAVRDYDTSTAHKIYPLGLPSPDQIAECVHKWLYGNGFEAGCVHPEDDLSGIKLYVIPHWEIIRTEWVPLLENYVRNGGVLVIGARSGTRTVDNQITAASFPGALSDLVGATVEEYGKQNPEAERVLYLKTAKSRILSEHWYEVLRLHQAENYAAWDNRFQAGLPAISIRSLGRGKVIYVGTYLSEPVCAGLLPELVELAGLQKPWPQLPQEIEAVRRVAADRELIFLINHCEGEITAGSLPEGDLLVGLTGLKFEPYGVKVIRRHC